LSDWNTQAVIVSLSCSEERTVYSSSGTQSL
jgi:hypothetical protein